MLRQQGVTTQLMSHHETQAAWGAIETYLQLYALQHAKNNKAQETSSKGAAELTPEERKKQKQKQRKVMPTCLA